MRRVSDSRLLYGGVDDAGPVVMGAGLFSHAGFQFHLGRTAASRPRLPIRTGTSGHDTDELIDHVDRSLQPDGGMARSLLRNTAAIAILAAARGDRCNRPGGGHSLESHHQQTAWRAS